MPTAKLKEYLDSRHVKYVVISHSLGYTAQEIASITHIPGKELAKTVMVNLDGALAMAVVPASMQVGITALKSAVGAHTAQLATEHEFRSHFPDCETGAMPPFGNLYGMSVYVDQSLAADTEIAFNAGTHRELIRLAYADFAKLVDPAVLAFAVPAGFAAVA
jgi:Ala-tRNA(Pro) deacylase